MTTGKPAGKKTFSRPRCGWDYSKMRLQQAERRTKEVAGRVNTVPAMCIQS